MPVLVWLPSPVLAGAEEVVAWISDEFALAACQANATLNGVVIRGAQHFERVIQERRRGENSAFDVISAADVLYDRDNMPLLDLLVGAC